MTSIDEIEYAIKPYLLTSIIFSIDGKQIKQGKLQLFCIKDFFCVFTLITNESGTKKIIYEVPYPFNIEIKNQKLIFDYTLDSFCLSNLQIKDQLSKIKTSKTSKFFNKKVIVSYA